MTTVVYAATDGEYSDYRVDRMFTRREDADQFAAVMGMNVEEFDLHDSLPEPRICHQIRAYVRVWWLARSPRVEVDDKYGGSPRLFPGVNGPRDNRPRVEVDRMPGYADIAAYVTVEGYDEALVRQAFTETVIPLVAEAEALLAAKWKETAP